MIKFFPNTAPFNTFILKVSDMHRLYVEEVGNPHGKPIVFLHGGPGGGIEEKHRTYFDPKVWRVILFDQRGCGKSTPFGELCENTTFDLIDDIEKIRMHLKIDKWHVFGGSWGSTLALAYAISHNQRVLSMFLRGIFLVRKKEIDWFYQGGVSYFYPEEWEKFLAPIPKNEQHDLLKAYHKRLNGTCKKELLLFAKTWSTWEGATSKLVQDYNMIDKFADDDFAYAFARIENHYFINKAFFPDDNYILNNINKIAHINGIIVQGRYDMPCPPISAYELHKAWPSSKLIIKESSGHSLSEPNISMALLEAVNKIGNE